MNNLDELTCKNAPVVFPHPSFEEVARRRGELLREAMVPIQYFVDAGVIKYKKLLDRISAELGEG